jgi:hypothetical protein
MLVVAPLAIKSATMRPRRRSVEAVPGGKIVARTRGRVAPQVMWRVKDPYLAPAPLRSVRKLVFKDEFEMASPGGWCAIGG